MEILPGILFGLLAMISWGISSCLAKKATDKCGAFQTVVISQTCGLIPIYIILLFTGIQIPTFEITAIILFTAFISTVSYLAYYKGLEIGHTSIVTPITSASSLVVFILSLIFLREKLIFNQFIGISLVIFGSLLTSFTKIKKAVKVAKGVPLGVIAMFGWGFSSLFEALILKGIGVVLTAFYLRTIIALFLITSSKIKKTKFSYPKKGILLTLFAIGILDTFGFLFFLYGIKIGLLSLVGPIGNSYAGVTVILAYFFLKEKLEKNQKIGVILLLLGIILASVIF